MTVLLPDKLAQGLKMGVKELDIGFDQQCRSHAIADRVNEVIGHAHPSKGLSSTLHQSYPDWRLLYCRYNLVTMASV